MRNSFFVLVGSFLVGCAGEAPFSAPTPDAKLVEPDAPPAAETGKRVSGRTRDYFLPATMLATTSVTTSGITPEKMAMSAADGSYALPPIAPNSKLYLEAARTGYRLTRNAATTIGEAAVTQDVFVMSVADVNRQYATAGVASGSGKSFVVAELRSAFDQPLVGVPATDIVLTDAENVAVPGVSVPVFFGAVGDVNPALTTSASYGGTSRVALMNVPPGRWYLRVTYPDGAAGTERSADEVIVGADSAVLMTAAGPVPGQGPADPRFTTDIYPKLQKGTAGGLGCANCHTAGGSGGAVLILDGGAQATASALANRTGMLVKTAPATSLLLMKPLYDTGGVQDHPNATFLDTTDVNYKLIYRWIANGTKF